MDNNKISAGDPPKKQQKQQVPNESMLRVSFLEQAATLLADTFSTSSSSQNTTPTEPEKNCPSTRNLLSRLLLRELRECAFVDQLRMHRDFKRSHCRRCLQSWVSSDPGMAHSQIEIKRRHGDQAIVRVCRGCGAERRFATNNPGYRSRNEKAGTFD